MTVFLDGADVRALATFDVTLRAARAGVESERAGRTVVPPRLDVDLEQGFLRVMPAAFDDVMGLKVMTLVRGLGTRYLILVYSQRDGSLIGALDADEVTRLRTAATTALAGSLLAPDGTSTLGLIGSGFEAEGHLRAFARLWPLERVRVYSRSAERREAFAARMSRELRLAVEPVASRDEALANAPVAVLATKATEPVVEGGDFRPGAVVLSIGSTRPDLRELDRGTLRRAAAVLVDDPRQVARESGDVIDALDSGAIEESRIVGMADPRALPGSDALARDGDRDLLVFKSVGTAIQDLALATTLLDAAREQGRGRDLGELTRLKPFAGAAKAVSSLAEGTAA